MDVVIEYRDESGHSGWVMLSQIVRLTGWGDFLDGRCARIHLANGEVIKTGEKLTALVAGIQRAGREEEKNK